jgi:cellobiose phosphorylase
LNPIYLSDSTEKVDEYRTEPYAMCADIYSRPPYTHRGGWSWYTGSAAWMYQLGLTNLLGFKKVGNTLQIDPVIPPSWDGFQISYKFGKTIYRINVRNPKHVYQGIKTIRMGGEILRDNSIPLVDDGHDHLVDIIMRDK